MNLDRFNEYVADGDSAPREVYKGGMVDAEGFHRLNQLPGAMSAYPRALVQGFVEAQTRARIAAEDEVMRVEIIRVLEGLGYTITPPEGAAQ